MGEGREREFEISLVEVYSWLNFLNFKRRISKLGIFKFTHTYTHTLSLSVLLIPQ